MLLLVVCIEAMRSISLSIDASIVLFTYLGALVKSYMFFFLE